MNLRLAAARLPMFAELVTRYVGAYGAWNLKDSPNSERFGSRLPARKRQQAAAVQGEHVLAAGIPLDRWLSYLGFRYLPFCTY